MQFRTKILLLLAAVLLPLSDLGEAKAGLELVLNGGFETGDFTGWAVSSTFTSVETAVYDGFSPYAGTYFAALGNVGATPLGTLSQVISDTSGQSYTLSMYLGS